MVSFVKIWPQIVSINLSHCSATMCLCLNAGVWGQLNIIIGLDMWWHDASDYGHGSCDCHIDTLFDSVTKMFFKTSKTYLMLYFTEIICAQSPRGLGHALISGQLFTIHSKIDHCTMGKKGGTRPTVDWSSFSSNSWEHLWVFMV